MVKIEVGPELGFQQLGDIVNNLTINGVNEVGLITSDLTWVEPCGIATITAYTHYLLNNGVDVYISDHVNKGSVEQYLQRVDFYNVLGIEKEENFRRWDGTGRFVEVKLVEDALTIERTAAQIAELYSSEIDLKNYMSYIILELINNAFHHSGSQIGAAVCAQYWPSAGKAQFCIVDCGIGYKTHLSAKYCVADDLQAISLALTKGITGKVENPYVNGYNNIGWGLHITSEMVKQNAGKLKIISGNGMYVIENGIENKYTITNKWPGVIFVVEMWDLDLKQTYQEFMSGIWGSNRSGRAVVNFE